MSGTGLATWRWRREEERVERCYTGEEGTESQQDGSDRELPRDGTASFPARTAGKPFQIAETSRR